MERYFCVDCEGVSIPGRAPMPSTKSGPCCPLCGSNRLRIWEFGKNIPDYYGRTPIDGAPEGGKKEGEAWS
jgi:hypothetical protein